MIWEPIKNYDYIGIKRMICIFGVKCTLKFCVEFECGGLNLWGDVLFVFFSYCYSKGTLFIIVIDGIERILIRTIIIYYSRVFISGNWICLLAFCKQIKKLDKNKTRFEEGIMREPSTTQIWLRIKNKAKHMMINQQISVKQ